MARSVGRAREEYFNEDFVEGAVRSLNRTIFRLRWRRGKGEWPTHEQVGKCRKLMETEIDNLIEEVVKSRLLGEITEQERLGRPVIYYDRKGQPRMKLKGQLS